MSEVRGQGSEVRGQRSVVRDQGSEVRGQRSGDFGLVHRRTQTNSLRHIQFALSFTSAEELIGGFEEGGGLLDEVNVTGVWD
jgi:hypothetical protein